MIKMTVGKKKSKQVRRESLNLPAANFLRKVSRFQKLQRTIARLSPSWQACIPVAAVIFLMWGYAAVAQTPAAAPTTEEQLASLKVGMDTMWVMVAGMLVFFMNAGFGMLETGFCRQKNAVNVLSKNLIVFALATIAYWAIGFGLMFSNGNGFIGNSGGFFLLNVADNSPAMGEAYQGIFKSLNWTGVPLNAKFFFQLVFAGTAATIVSGAVAERIKFLEFLIFCLLLVGIAYPITGHWIWGGGWLQTAGFYDFAGSAVVHSVGGWAALMGAAFLGPRIGKYRDGETVAMPGHNMSIATLGCLILWLGWFGFNPGSTMAVDPNAIAHIAITTNTAGAFGGVAATITAWLYLGKPDLSMIINGILAGLVGVTASCAWVNVPNSAIIGAIAGVMVVFAVTFFDNLQIDDPVGATSVHLVCGTWGTLAVGLFSDGPGTGIYTAGPKAGLLLGGGFDQLLPQLIGIISVGGMTVLLSTIFWLALKALLGIRVSALEEAEGLDIGEHGMEAYTGFVKETSSGNRTESSYGGYSGGGGDKTTKL
ncbi:MAG: ammonium transporter [Microcoleus sp. PH2017_10_PVI_O_A]|uniref:ammonium transporter n=2 Tax=Microcoleus TaxID=44471 RepID=UPI001DA58FBC|nr:MULTISPECIES: ammonium transporter [unclassified Microcoleus]MCC3409726.1 ammonium transporter [Microcoleus sp. PH2017_10_PVI_O_A]MCC3463992.1 ammonium transporter [Microcoleus sp. PH2017_11_PCY_U_A]MCC3482322.1 ammonium transporter [Microcoleus sp. PH2017_12_PCY_D_A]MCC3532173.1 ammonium transporter [Microcoleus sp. PH2017_21_RUC_O_A]MCC3544488.1 ammonium transporter [Microcoleus sp. PH2017_22_RUC_O_B]